MIIASHSQYSAAVQKWLIQHQPSFDSMNIDGQVLIGAAPIRDAVHINKDGTSKLDFNIPTLSISGELDGLMRVSRVAESFYHTYHNIE